MSWRSHLLALLYEGQDVVLLDLRTSTEIGRIEGAGGSSCQEVLYDVSQSIFPQGPFTEPFSVIEKMSSRSLCASAKNPPS